MNYRTRDPVHNEDAVTSNIEYLYITAVLMIIIAITTISLNSVVIKRPIDQFSEYAFIDIGNGISTRIVDLYIIAPQDGNISTKFDIPDEVAGQDYTVQIVGGTGDKVSVFRGDIQRDVGLAGIGNTLGTQGSTSSAGLNQITYLSKGYEAIP